MDIFAGHAGKVAERTVEEIRLMPEGGHVVVVRAKHKWNGEATFSVKLSKSGQRRRKREKHIEELKEEAQAKVVSFCKDIISSFETATKRGV